MDRLMQVIEGKEHWYKLNDYIETIQAKSESNPNFALDASKSLVESVAKTVLNDCGIELGVHDSLNVLVKNAYENLDVLKELLAQDNISGKKIVNSLASVAQSIGEFRNNHGYISHGMDLATKRFNDYLLDLCIASAELLSCFLIKCHDQDYIDRHRIHYDNYDKFNKYFNDSIEEYPRIGDISMEPSRFLFFDIDAYKTTYLDFLETKTMRLDEFQRNSVNYDVNELIDFLEYFEVAELEMISEYICVNKRSEYVSIARYLCNELDQSKSDRVKKVYSIAMD